MSQLDATNASFIKGLIVFVSSRRDTVTNQASVAPSEHHQRDLSPEY